MKKLFKYFSKVEIALWTTSTIIIITVFMLFDKNNYLTLFATLIGVTAIIFNAKGNAIGQFLMIIFSIIYAIISYTVAYYGELATYVGMTLPMCVFALISWLKNPYEQNKLQVKVKSISKKEHLLMWVYATLITGVFFFVLKHFNTPNLALSTLSITTSFIAVYLSFCRSPFFALAYAFNDVVLIILWALANVDGTKYLTVMVCFFAFLFNDLYCFYNWLKIKKNQNN